MKKDIDRFEAAWRAMNGDVVPLAALRFHIRRTSLTPFQITRLDAPFRKRVRFSQQPKQSRILRFFGRVGPRDWDTHLTKNPYDACVAIHAPDGRVREAAVRHLPLEDTAAFAVLLLRCNDWVGPVRKAAFARLNAALPALDTATLAPICLFVLDRATSWHRGQPEIESLFQKHPAWPSAKKTMFLTTDRGALARNLRRLLRAPGFDWALPDLAMGAKSTFVRAIAVETILGKRANWSEGYMWKAFGGGHRQQIRIPKLRSRPIVVPDETLLLVLRVSCTDKSPAVRKLAADYLIAQGDGPDPEIVKVLRSDKAKSVQERMAFFDKKWCGNQSTRKHERI